MALPVLREVNYVLTLDGCIEVKCYNYGNVYT